MMSRVFCLLLILAASDAVAGDYWLKIEIEKVTTTSVRKSGRRVTNEKKEVPTLEALCRLGEPFRVRSTFGPESLTAAGVLSQGKKEPFKGKLLLEICISDIIDSGITVPLANGKKQPILNITKTSSNITLEPNVPREIGGIITRSTKGDADRPWKSKTFNVVVTVTKSIPTDDHKAKRPEVMNGRRFLLHRFQEKLQMSTHDAGSSANTDVQGSGSPEMMIAPVPVVAPCPNTTPLG